jgi:hypothetical protein
MNEKAGNRREGDSDGGTVEQESGEFQYGRNPCSPLSVRLSGPPAWILRMGNYRSKALYCNRQVKKLYESLVLVQISENRTSRAFSVCQVLFGTFGGFGDRKRFEHV